MKVTIIVFVLALSGQAYGQLGELLVDAKSSLGPTVDTYPYDGRSTEYEFKTKEGEITIVPIGDKIALVSFWLAKEPTEELIRSVLKRASSEEEWVFLPDKPESVTRNFPGKIPTHGGHLFFRSSSGRHHASYSKDWFDRFVLTVVTSTFIDDLKKLPRTGEENEAEQGADDRSATAVKSKAK